MILKFSDILGNTEKRCKNIAYKFLKNKKKSKDQKF